MVLLPPKVPKEKILMIGWIATKNFVFLAMTVNAKTLVSGRLKSTLLIFILFIFRLRVFLIIIITRKNIYTVV